MIVIASATAFFLVKQIGAEPDAEYDRAIWNAIDERARSELSSLSKQKEITDELCPLGGSLPVTGKCRRNPRSFNNRRYRRGHRIGLI